MNKQKKLYIFGIIAAAVLIVVVVLLLVFSGNAGKYEKHYEAAESAFMQKDYATALKELDHAMEIEATEDCYLLMANVYNAQGDRDMAIQVLYLGYSHTGSDAVARMLDRLEGEQTPTPVAPPSGSDITVGGDTFAPDTTSAVLSGKSLGNADILALSDLSAMQELSLSNNALSDISPLAKLQALTSLQLSGNRVADLTPLSGLKNLKTLYLDGNPVEDFSPLYSLSSLRTLSIKNIIITDTALEELQAALPNCRIYSEIPVETVPEITLGGRTFRADVTELSLGGLEITDISALAECTQLRDLDLRDNKISDLSPLAELTGLERLCLWNNEVEDLSPLLGMTKLRYLDIDTNAVSDILILSQLPQLEELWLNNNPIESIEPLSALTGLTRLGLKNLALTDDSLDVLMGLSALKELSLEENEGLGRAKVDALKEALPKCTVSHGELVETEPDETDPAAPPVAPDAAYISVGAAAAADAAGSGSGYAVVWNTQDATASGIRSGFVTQAQTLSMNVVADLGFVNIESEADSLATALRSLGADVVILAGNDEVLSSLFTALQILEYMPHIIQVYD